MGLFGKIGGAIGSVGKGIGSAVSGVGKSAGSAITGHPIRATQQLKAAGRGVVGGMKSPVSRKMSSGRR